MRPLALSLLLAGCTSIDLTQEWELDRLRLLGVAAEPAEPQPGQTVTFSSLAYIPGDAEWTALWFACVEGSRDGCELDPTLVEQLAGAEDLEPEEQAALLAQLQEAGLAGYEPYLPPSWTVPEDALDGLDEDQSLEGLGATVQITLSTADDNEIVIRRVPVSLASTPNHNPVIGKLEADDASLLPEVAFTVSPGQSVAFRATLEGGVEAYSYKNTDGEWEEREEEPSWRWYTDLDGLDAGAGFQFGSSDDPAVSEMNWVAPDAAATGEVDVVCLDGRGGMGWWHLEIVVE